MKPSPPPPPFHHCWLAVLVVTSYCSGCQLFRPSPPRTPAPEVFQAAPQQTDLFELVNGRTERVRQVQAETTVGLSGLPAKLSGSLIVEQPNRLRLKVSPLGMESLGADIGSNDHHFWVWVKSGGVMTDSMLMYADHQEYARSEVATVMPLEPRWVTDSLGLVRFESGSQYHGPSLRKDGRLEVRSYQSTARGTQASILVFDPRTGLLRQKSLYDPSGNLVGYCDLNHYHYFAEEDVALPTEMKLHFRPGTTLESVATIHLSNLRLNGLYVDPETAWAMPNPQGVPRVDLSVTPMTPPALGSVAGGGTTLEGAPSENWLPFRGKLLRLAGY